MSKDIKFNFLNPDEEERYQKHLTLKEIGYEGQLNLKNSAVLCIGAGGLGSSVLLYLAAAGIGRIGKKFIVSRTTLIIIGAITPTAIMPAALPYLPI